MAKKLSKVGIVTNQLVLPHQVTQSIDAFTGDEDYDINLSGSLAITGSTTIKLGGLTISDSILGPGSLNVTNITASNLQVVNISSSFVTSSTIYTSGSNIFGDEASDTHTFIGGITASGVMSASGVVFGSQVRTPAVFTDTITEKTSTSGVTIEGTLLKDNDVTTTDLTTTNNVIANGSVLTDTITEKTSAAGVTIEGTLLKDNNIITVGYISSSGNIETDGYFSGSGEGLNNIPAAGITGLNLSRIASGSVTASIAPNKGFEVNTNITASGNITAGGDVSIPRNSKLTLDGDNGSNSYITQTNSDILQIVNQGNTLISAGSGFLSFSSIPVQVSNQNFTVTSPGTITGDGAGLTNIPAAGITGLNLSRIASGSVTASIAPNRGFEVNTGITASGNIVIENASPLIQFKETDTTDQNWAFINSGGTMTLRTANDDFSNYLTRMAFSQNGNVGIGNASPNSKLDVSGNINATGEIECTKFIANAGGGFEFEIEGDNQFNMTHTVANRSMFFVTTTGTGNINFGTNNVNSQLSIKPSAVVITNDLIVTGSTVIKGSDDSQPKVLELKNSTSQGSILKIQTDNESANRPVGIYFSASNQSAGDFAIGLHRDTNAFAIGHGAENAANGEPIFEMSATGAITASGDISCSFQESTITATTGSFNHLITDGETLEFRNATTRAKVGSLKFDPTNGLEVRDSTGAEGRVQTKTLSIPSNGSLVVAASQIDFTGLPTSDPGVAGRLYRDSRDNKIIVSVG